MYQVGPFAIITNVIGGCRAVNGYANYGVKLAGRFAAPFPVQSLPRALRAVGAHGRLVHDVGHHHMSGWNHHTTGPGVVGFQCRGRTDVWRARWRSGFFAARLDRHTIGLAT